jgi:hypothetical protein
MHQGASFAIVNIIKAGGDDIYDLSLYKSQQENSVAFVTPVVAVPVSTATASITSGIPVKTLPELNLTEADRSIVATGENGELPFNQSALQRYVLYCGQNYEGGGLRGFFLIYRMMHDDS